MTQLRLGLIGCSNIARRRTLPSLPAAGNTQLVAVSARSLERAKQFAAEFDAVALTYEEMLASPDVDAVYLSLPNGLHHEWTMKALRAGKHVLCEKPLTTSAAQAEELTDAAEQHQLVLRENFTFLHHPQHERVRGLVADGRLGELRSFTAAFAIPPLPDNDIRYDPTLGGGALLDVGVYPLRAAQLLLGNDLSVAGASLRWDERSGVDVAGQVLLVAGNGVFANLEFGFQHSYQSRYALWGSGALLSLDRAFTPPNNRQPVLRIDEQDHTEEIWLPPADQFTLSIRSFAQAALSGAGTAVEAGWRDAAVVTARLVDEILRTALRAAAGEGGKS